MNPTYERPSSEAGRLQARNWLLRQLGWERTLELMREGAGTTNAGTWPTARANNRVPAHRDSEYGPARQRRAS
jgi:hypothetical protein